jgi:predicted porin
MNKKLLVAAIAAAATLPMAAQAGVQIYGVIHASIDYVDSDRDDVRSFWDVSSSSGRSRIGVKGTEDLGNGLKAIWKAESEVNMDNGGQGKFTNRNTYIGLAGDWGTFLYGRHDTPLKISTGKLDFFADTLADYNSTLGFIDRRVGDAIAYISPNMAGFTVAGAAVPGHDANSGADGIADGYSLAAMYSNNAIYASLAYEDISDWLNLGIDDTIWRVGLGWLGETFQVVGVYENQDVGSGSNNETRDVWQISAGYNFGNNTLKGMYGQAGNFGFSDLEINEDDDKRDAWAIGLDHKLSKRTKAYVLYTDSELAVHDHVAETLGGGSAFSMGMVHKF